MPKPGFDMARLIHRRGEGSSPMCRPEREYLADYLPESWEGVDCRACLKRKRAEAKRGRVR